MYVCHYLIIIFRLFNYANFIVDGSSLQHASEIFRIPKTVLWRRIQKEGYQILRRQMKRSYALDTKEAAVKALERGENLTKVALEFKVNFITILFIAFEFILS